MRTMSQLLQKPKGRSRAAEGNLLAPLDFRLDSRATRCHERVVERCMQDQLCKVGQKGKAKEETIARMVTVGG